MCQSCFREDIPFGDLGGGGSVHFPSLTQAIVTSYQFQCCGDITAWQTYVEPSGGMHQNGAYSITIQIWRPLPSVDSDGCYSLVGEDRYIGIQLIQGEDGLVNRTLDPSSFISVQPGDVLGYFTLLDNDEDGGIQHDPEFNMESVWYHTSTVDDPLMTRGALCPFPVGEDVNTRVLRTFSSLGPIFSVNIASYSCPTTEAATTSADNTQHPTSELSTPGDTADGTTATTAGSTAPIPTDNTPTIAGVSSSAAVLVTLLIILLTCTLCIVIRRRGKKLLEPSENVPMVTNECYAVEEAYARITDYSQYKELSTTDITTVTNECYSTSRLPSPTRPRVHQQQDMQLTQNQDVLTADDIPTVTNECYSTSRLPSPTRPRVHQQQDKQLTQNQDVLTADNIPTVTNECYSTSRLPSPTRPRVLQQQDMELTQNQAHCGGMTP